MTTYVNIMAVDLFGKNVVHLIKGNFPEHIKGRVTFPGGRMEIFDKSVEEAAKRELHEETGVYVDSKNIIILRKVETEYGPLFNCLCFCNIDEAKTMESELVFIKEIDAKLDISCPVVNAQYADDYVEILSLAMPYISQRRLS